MKIVFNASLKDEDTLIKTDKEKLLAVLSNLIKNALKYSRKGIIEFGYSLKDEMLEFYVKDMGIGIPLNRQKAIFDRFVQADIEDIKVFEGAGLGLSISQAYVEMLDGKIWVNSVEGQGSKFYFTIPYSQVVKESIVVEKKNMDISVSTHKTSKKLKLLIVEDELYADEYLSIVFEDYCSEILHADNGQKAVEECRKNPDIDLVFMDIKMPILDGHEATLQIREFNKDIIIIAQTANALIGDREKALEVGCNEYISKPIQIDELKEKIEALLDVKF